MPNMAVLSIQISFASVHKLQTVQHLALIASEDIAESSNHLAETRKAASPPRLGGIGRNKVGTKSQPRCQPR
jgi:hypothetical protein